MAEKVHWKTAQKLAKEGSVESIPEAPEAPVASVKRVVDGEYRIMSKRGDVLDYTYSKKEAEEKVRKYEGGYIVTL